MMMRVIKWFINYFLNLEGGNDTLVAEYSKFKVELSPQQQVPKSANSHHKKVESTPSTGSSSTTVGRTPRPSVTSTTTSSSVITSATIYQRKEVLRLVFNLSGAMYARQAEQGLLMYVYGFQVFYFLLICSFFSF